MKTLSLILWVTQFDLSILFPPCFFLWLATYLQQKHGFGVWTTVVGGSLGVLIAVSTAKANWRAMRKEAEAGSQTPPISFNDHK